MGDQWFLRAIRKELGITQEDLAREAGTRQIDISALERGTVQPLDTDIAAIIRLVSARAAARAFEHVILAAWPQQHG
jgi:predicted transcriptional regulator